VANCPIDDRREGLLHDARNLMGALGLYCDLLAVPGVLKPEHRHYAEEVRLLGSRSGALIERLMERVIPLLGETAADGAGLGAGLLQAEAGCPAQAGARTPADRRDGDTEMPAREMRAQEMPAQAILVQAVSLRSVVERCAGLLSRVAGGRPMELSFGAAAAVPVQVAEETVERILVNLVRNAAAALAGCPLSGGPGKDLTGSHGCAAEGPAMGGGGRSVLPGTQVSVRETSLDRLAGVAPGTIRIGVGLLADRVGEARAWPFRRVRLTVEDSGCGMTPEQLGWLLSSARGSTRGHHGIGFRVVRELVAASDGELKAMSAPGTGTRVQIEWPMAALASLESGHGAGERADASGLSGDAEPFAREPVTKLKRSVQARRLGDPARFAEGQGA
jgi:signal transduction histidine kinase